MLRFIMGIVAAFLSLGIGSVLYWLRWFTDDWDNPPRLIPGWEWVTGEAQLKRKRTKEWEVSSRWYRYLTDE